MIIQSAQIQFDYTHTLTETYTQAERVVSDNGDTGRSVAVSTADQISLSSVSSLTPASSELSQENGTQGNVEVSEVTALDAKTLNLKTLVESFIGKEITLSTMQIDDALSQSSENLDSAQSDESQNTQVVFQRTERYAETESSLFSASGEVLLASGETLNINFSQYSARSFIQETSVELSLGEPTVLDPLVVNIDGTGLSLTQNRYAFDLNNDGTDEDIVFATQGSAFLALDRNNNGSIDNGSELFGALTGNGYAELAQFDEDGNQFIDSGDSAFSRLQLLSKNADGTDSLTSLQNAKIGAIYLGNSQTPFQIKDENNDLQALVRRSSVFIKEDGTTGSTQQIDLVV